MIVTINNQELSSEVTYTTPFFQNQTPHIKSNKFNKNYLYSLLIVDPDAPYPSNPTKKYILHLLVVNNKDIKANYHSPHPPDDSPAHRYYVLLYKQPKYIKMDYVGYKPNFNLEEFVSTNELKLVDNFTFHCMSLKYNENFHRRCLWQNTKSKYDTTFFLKKEDIIKTLPFSKTFLQGLLLLENKLYSSSGLYGKSMIQSMNLPALNLERQISLPDSLFGEDITYDITNNKIYQCTWKENKILEWDLQLEKFSTYNYPWEGWGLCHDGTNFWSTDGSSYIRTWSDPKNPLKDFKQFMVHHKKDNNSIPVSNLNSMEWFPAGTLCSFPVILVFEWLTPYLHAVEPYSGKILFSFDLTALYPESIKNSHEECPNGITRRHLYNNEINKENTFWISGKGWDVIYEMNIKINS